MSDKYDYQPLAVEDAVSWASTAKPGDVRLYSSPTGTGKSYIELEVQRRLGWYIMTPRLEIARGFLEKAGLDPQTEKELIDQSQALNIWTPIRFRNALFSGRIPEVRGLIVDEGHHQLANSYRDDWVAAGMPPMLLYTATPYRGTAKATAKFREDFGEPIPIISLIEAAQRGVISIPVCEVIPLIDDDIVTLSSSGEFDIVSLENETLDRLSDLARIADERWACNGRWLRPTVFSVPGVESARRLAATLRTPAVAITASTTSTERRNAFARLRESDVAVVQVSVLGEGVDLPIRRLVDLAPCMSPVKWMQQLGRATRPINSGEEPPSYVCTNRNLLRHGYLLDGLVPATKLAEATELFGGLGVRAGHRALGLESLGRFRAVNVKLTDGNICQLYLLTDTANGRMREFACLAHPCLIDPIWAHRVHGLKADGSRDYGTWVKCDPPAELRGFTSQSAREPTEPMVSWWKKRAKYRGLDPDVKLSRKNFAALPICENLNLRLARS